MIFLGFQKKWDYFKNSPFLFQKRQNQDKKYEIEIKRFDKMLIEEIDHKNKGVKIMYIAIESFATKDYDIKRKQLLEDDFTSPEEIAEFLDIGYIEVYVPSQEVDTTDATAEADNIVTGKTAYARGEKLTGTYTGIVPTGTKNITENGTVDVSEFASANVNVQGSSSTNNAKILPRSGNYFNIYTFIESIDDNYDVSAVTEIRYLFSSLYSLKKAPTMNTSHITNAQQLFNQCESLITVPVYDFSSLTGNNNYNMFGNCMSLSNDSLNNILQMCIGMTGVANKTLKYMGISSTQATTCQSLSNWSNFVAAGWSTGY